MSTQTLTALERLTIKQWKTWNPMMFSEMEADGSLMERVRSAISEMEDEMDILIQQGMVSTEAEEVAMKDHILIPAEPHLR